MTIKIFKILITGLSCLAFAASACSLGGLQHTVKFSPNSAELGAKEARELVEWFIDRRDRLGISYTYAYTNSLKDNQKTRSLSDARLKNILFLLEPLRKGTIEIKYGDAPLENSEKEAQSYFLNVVNVGIQPKCAETDSCCGGGDRM